MRGACASGSTTSVGGGACVMCERDCLTGLGGPGGGSVLDAFGHLLANLSTVYRSMLSLIISTGIRAGSATDVPTRVLATGGKEAGGVATFGLLYIWMQVWCISVKRASPYGFYVWRLWLL